MKSRKMCAVHYENNNKQIKKWVNAELLNGTECGIYSYQVAWNDCQRIKILCKWISYTQSLSRFHLETYSVRNVRVYSYLHNIYSREAQYRFELTVDKLSFAEWPGPGLLDNMIYLLNAIGLSPGGSSTVHIYTQTIHRTIQNKQYKEQHNNFGRVRAVPRLG